ncbi:replication initiator [Streptomyces sp. ITFR-6]|uniref:replication initiator n=1 Tax=Streptomyces sp. ITFR-6 TaxID=3075197 RepID=UPI00288BC696|nr:replication initiator [Streptomyces sp. ITFR-6]WNI31377.1 plasmid replication initiator protein [Streptomyces sp. ITFR-6]
MDSNSFRRPVPPAGRPYLTDTERDLIRLANEPGFRRWLEQIKATGGCAHPVYLSGHTTTIDAATGAVLRHYDTATEPGGRLPIRCRNRRESVCPPCSRLHAGDTFHLVRAGLLGGKGTPATVALHPRLFVTLTAPSFGAVHRITRDGSPCRPRRNANACEHGRSLGCGLTHTEEDQAAGKPLCTRCYDYTGHVLWHAHAGDLWNRTTISIRRHVATEAGITQSRLRDHARLSFAKVAEYQRRGAVHFHAVIRLDGPNGPDSQPPTWATADLLATAVKRAAGPVYVPMPHVSALGEPIFRWGAQTDCHPIDASAADIRMSDQAVAAYIAKYVSKSVGDAGGTDRPVTSAEEIGLLPVSAHLRTLMLTCWRLGRLPELDHLRLRMWAHALGFRGHILTKSLRYSTTYGELRASRCSHHFERDDMALDEAVVRVTESAWRYVGSGHTDSEMLIAAGIASDLAQLRDVRREEGF